MSSSSSSSKYKLDGLKCTGHKDKKECKQNGTVVAWDTVCVCENESVYVILTIFSILCFAFTIGGIVWYYGLWSTIKK